MNWNEPHTGDYDEVFLLLESGKIIHVPTHRVIEKVVGWMTVDQYIQQTKALAQPGAFVGQWKPYVPCVSEPGDEELCLVRRYGWVDDEVYHYTVVGFNYGCNGAVEPHNFYEVYPSNDHYSVDAITHFCSLQIAQDAAKSIEGEQSE